MRLLAIGRPRSGIDPQTAIAPHASEELRQLWALYRGGVVREMYSPGDPGIVLILEAPSPEAAEKALAALPLAANHIIEFEVIEMLPFTAIEMLFSEDRTG